MHNSIGYIVNGLLQIIGLDNSSIR